MILLDFSAIIFAAIHVDIKGGTKPNFEYIRHLALNTIRHQNNMHKREYGEMYLIFDSKSWRQSAFPLYKWARQHDREINPDQDWEILFEMVEEIKRTLIEHFPYPTVEVKFAEADDIIGVMCRNAKEKVLVSSNDKDFGGLLKYKRVSQYRPSQKSFLEIADPVRFEYELIMKGDKSDGVPNIFSPDDFLKQQVLDKEAGLKPQRAKPVSQKYMDSMWEVYSSNDEALIEKEFGPLYKNFRRNRRLVSLDWIPDILVESINKQLQNLTRQPIMKAMEYMTTNRMTLMAHHLGDFEPNRTLKTSLI